MLLLLFIYHSASTITDEQQQHYLVTTRTKTTTERSIYINCSILNSSYLDWCFYCHYCCCYCVIMLLFLLCNYVVVHLSLCIHNYRWTRTKLHSNNNKNNNNKQINLHKLCNLFVSDLYCCYFVLLLLFLFSCSCWSAITDEQQQHSTVKTSTTKQINVHKFLNVQELISHVWLFTAFSNCILQNVKLTWCGTALDHQMPLPGGYIWLSTAFAINCIPQHVKMTWCSTALGHQMPLLGGKSDCHLPSQLHSVECQGDLT